MKNKSSKPQGAIMTSAFQRAGYTDDKPVAKKSVKHQRPRNSKIFALPALRTIGLHGVDHINCVYSAESQTPTDADIIGTMLSTTYRYNISHPILGKFSGVENMIWYLRTERDRLRYVAPDKAAMMGKVITRESQENTDEKTRLKMMPTHLLAVIIGDTYWGIVQDNPHLKQLLINSTLPFDIYFRDNTTKSLVRPRSSDWLCFIFEQIRIALKLEEKSGVHQYPDLGRVAQVNSQTGALSEIEFGDPNYEEAVKEMIKKVCSPIVGILPADPATQH